MTKLTIILSIFLFTPNLFAQKYIIKIGETLILPINSTQSLNIKGNFIKWIDKGSQLKIIGTKEGLTKIKSLSYNYKVQVLSKDKFEVYLKYKDLLKKLKGLEVGVINNTLTINGNLYRLSDWEKINLIAHKHQNHYLMNAKIDNDVRALAKKKLMPLLFSYSQLMPELKLIPHPTIYRLKSDTSQDFDHIVKLQGFKVKDHSNNNISKQIRLHLNFIEINDSQNYNFGVTFSGAFQAKIYRNFIDNSSFDAYLNQVAGKGIAHIIYQTQIICEINRECKFSEGGQFPVRTSGYINSSVVWKDYGLIFKFTPNLLSGEKIKIKLQYDLSHLDSHGDGEVPAIKSKSLTTYVNTKNKIPIIVSGLENSVTRKNNAGPIPFVGIPLLNKILNSNTNSKSNTKMLLAITPTLLNRSE